MISFCQTTYSQTTAKTQKVFSNYSGMTQSLETPLVNLICSRVVFEVRIHSSRDKPDWLRKTLSEVDDCCLHQSCEMSWI